MNHYDDPQALDYGDPYHSGYADRPGFYEPRHRGYRDASDPRPASRARALMDDRHRRAYADRELARRIDSALYEEIGDDADAIAVYAADAVVTLEGTLPSERAAQYVLDNVRAMPGVRRVRNALRVRRR